MKKRLFCLLFALLMLLQSCGPDTPDVGENPDTGDNGQTVVETTPVIADGKTTYVILVDNNDVAAKAFGSALQSEVFKKCGLLIAVRNVGVNVAGSDVIYVGEHDTEQMNALKAQVEASSFGVSVQAGSMAFYAKDAAGYAKMENYLRDQMLASAAKGTWSAVVGKHSVAEEQTSVEYQINTNTPVRVVYDHQSSMATTALILASRLKTECGVAATAVADTGVAQPNEILLGAVDRDSAKNLSKYTKGSSFFSGVVGNAYVIQGGTELALVHACCVLLDSIKAGINGSTSTVTSASAQAGTLDLMPRDDAFAELVAKANRFSGTYSSMQDKKLASASDAIKKDQALAVALVKRMGTSLAVMVGSSSALHNGYIVKLDRQDYSKVTKLGVNGHVYVSSDYVSEYFGEKLTADADGYVDLTAYCSTKSGYKLEYLSAAQIAVVVPDGVDSYSNLNQTVGSYKNAEYIARMKAFFQNPQMPEPDSNVEQTRSVVTEIDADQYPRFYYNYAAWGESDEGAHMMYSPGILVREENGKRVIYACHEYVIQDSPRNTYLKRSLDDGKTWEQILNVPVLYWGSITEVNGKIYLIGNGTGGAMMIVEYDPATGKDRTATFSNVGQGGGSPNTVLVAKGRIYKAYNNAVASAPITSDLLKQGSWSFSNNCQTQITRDLFKKITGVTAKDSEFDIEEGDVVMAPDGQLFVMYRLNPGSLYGYVALFKLSDDGKKITLDDVTGGIMRFPYTKSKFSLIYDESLGLYIALTSINTLNHTDQRNVLGLVVSEDLYNWETVSVLLTDRQMVNQTYSMWGHGFQYVDFVTAGEDLYFIVREAVGDSFNYHDANFTTVYKIAGYKEFITSRRAK